MEEPNTLINMGFIESSSKGLAGRKNVVLSFQSFYGERGLDTVLVCL